MPKNVRCLSWSDVTPTVCEELDAVINLAGEPVADGRWTTARKAEILRSRVEATRSMVQAISKATQRPGVLINASGVGYYGPRDDQPVTESTSAGSDFLAGVCEQWEAEALRAEAAGVRVVRARIGVVLGDRGGALEKMLLPFKLFVGGPVGDGQQFFPWIHIEDVVGSMMHALDHTTLHGAMNCTAPEPVRFRDFSKALGKVMGRPSWMSVPGFALRLAVGEMAEVLLTGQKAIPKALLDDGYVFRHTNLEEALRYTLSRNENVDTPKRAM
jgi:uncharacterized protein